MAFVRRVKTTSGATAVQVVYKRYGEITKIVHIGSSHTEQGIKVLEREAHQKMHLRQGALFEMKRYEELKTTIPSKNSK